ncbi:uncharacterized protein PG986_011656 [Apiospora aurea]|uniref:PLL-like beta propeller domain-containing protein n=1 Tax=Apiospora aurea TaxID=335848 RepID=A0ABR1PXS6_9PEZI
MVLVGSIGIVVLLGAVLGGVLGSRATKVNENNSERVYALTKNGTHSIYRKWRSFNATSMSDFTPQRKGMALVGGSVDTNLSPSIAVGWQLIPAGSGFVNRTELHASSMISLNGCHKFHDNDQPLFPDGPDGWDAISSTFEFLSAPTMIQYAESERMIKVFGIGQGKYGAVMYYFHLDPGLPWTDACPIRDDGPNLHPWATPAVVAWAGNDSRLDVFAVSLAETDEWAEYKDLKGFATVPPTAISREPGRLDVFTRGGNGGLWHLSYENGNWSAGWNQISGSTRIQGQPEAVSTSAENMDVFALGVSGALLYKTYDGATRKWTPEDGFTTLIPSGLVGHPKSISEGDEVHVFVYNNQNQLLW